MRWSFALRADARGSAANVGSGAGADADSEAAVGAGGSDTADASPEEGSCIAVISNRRE